MLEVDFVISVCQIVRLCLLPDTHKEWLRVRDGPSYIHLCLYGLPMEAAYQIPIRSGCAGLFLDFSWTSAGHGGCSLRCGQTPIRSGFGVSEVAVVISVCQCPPMPPMELVSVCGCGP